MTDTIICNAVLQPHAYGHDPSKFSAAVSLSFAYRADAYSPSSSEDHARERFEQFLRVLPKAKFRVYRRGGSASSPPEHLEPAEWTATEEHPPSGATPVEKIMAWLDCRRTTADGTRISQYWVTEDPLIGSPGTSTHRFKLNDLKATHYLDTSVAWAAPLPQDAGLVRNLTLMPTIASPPHPSPPPRHVPGDLIVVPFFDNDIPFDPQHFEHLNDSHDLLRFTYDAGAGFSHATAELRFLDVDAMNATGLMDIDNGFLVAPDDSDDAETVATILKRIEDRSASLFWAFPSIHAIDWKDKDAPRHSPPAEITRLVWRAMNGLATLLDPVVVSLIMPPPGDPTADSSIPNPDGPFVSALRACIDHAWQDAAKGAPHPPPAPDTSGLSRAVEDALRTNLLVDESAQEKRRGLVKLLIICLAIKDNAEIKFQLADPATVKNAPSLIWLLMKYYAEVAPGSRSPEFIENATNRFGSGGDPATLEVALSNELGGLARQLQADDGIEQVVLRLLDTIGISVNSGKIPGVSDANIARQALTDFRTFITGNFNPLDAVRHAQARLYELYLVKAAVSAGKSSPDRVERWSADDLKKAIEKAQWFVRRLDPNVKGTFDRIGLVLPIYAASVLAPDDKVYVADVLKTAFATVCDELIPAAEEGQRFVPEAAPKRLQLQIGVDSDLTHLKDFAHAYSGLGVLVRCGGRKKWAYANLADLAIYEESGSPSPPGVSGSPSHHVINVIPLQPVAVDQQYSLFLPYDGFPFTSKAFAKTHAPGAAADDLKAFFTFTDPKDMADFARLPPLAYGETYDVAAFVIGKGGALPRSTQAETQPWMPSHDPEIPPPADGKTYARGYPYQRTTAIGRVALNETGRTKRIGAGIDRVQPLFQDYPRVGLCAHNGSSVLDLLRNPDGTGALSLPQPTGSPPAFSPSASSPPAAGNTTRIVLEDVWWWGKQGMLTVSVFASPDPAPTDPGERAWTFAVSGAFAGATLTLEISRSDFDSTLTFTCRLTGGHAGPSTPEATQVIDADCFGEAEAIWLRLAISSSTLAALSFAVPAAAGGQITARRTSDSLVLVAPDSNPSEWRTPHAQPVKADIIFPRVGFNDFDRWLNNSGLAKETMASVRDQPPTDPDQRQFKKFRRLVLAAYVLRNHDPQLSALLDSLPDLAVDRLLVELTPLDALYDEPPRVVGDASKLGRISRVVRLNTLGARLRGWTLPDRPDVKDLKQILDPVEKLSRLCSASLVISSSDYGNLSIKVKNGDVQEKNLTVTVPRGMVARLTIRPMVPARYFELAASPPSLPPFGDKFETLATEKRGDHYVFEGASLVIESMVGAFAGTAASPQLRHWMDGIDPENNRSYHWENLVAKAVAVRAGSHRSYDLVARPQELKREAHGWWWRQLATIDVETQRWRFTGRPIYSWLDPKHPQKKKNGQPPVPNVAIEQTWSQNDNGTTVKAITRFEDEIFFDRDDADADSRTAQLNPAPNETVLQSFPWEQPSATYFRHRLTIHSRYEGALAAGQVAVQRAWGEDSDFNDESLRNKHFARSWIRVAMLADRTRLQLTRPQLRALIPLTVAPANPEVETPAATPPVMGILDERPFAHGGLADRIAAEIMTGFGYELPGSPAIFQIADARKEFGPDPRLTYMPTPDDEAQAMTLRNEGPVGLTFDSSNVRAAVFANTALVLHPTRLTPTGPPPASMEEHFLSVGLRRYLDPAWLTAEAVNDYSIKNPLWITWRITDPHRGFRLGVQGTVQSRDLINVEQEGGVWAVWFDAALIDVLPQQDVSASPPIASPALSPDPNFKKLCTIYAGAVTGLAFLHLPLEKGRSSLSVFAQPSAVPASLSDSAVLAGDGNQPLMMGSIEWQVPAGTTDVWFDDHGTKQTSASLTSASPTTLMNWTRTGRNFELWHATKDGKFAPYTGSNVVARWTDDTKPECAFFDARDPDEDDEDPKNQLNFEPHSSRYGNPLYVHRHHAVIGTRKANGVGRPVEVYTGVSRYFGEPFSVPKNSQAVRLVEFETPARPLAWFPGGRPRGRAQDALSEFQTAHFDLVSIWGKTATSKSHGSPVLDPGVSLFIRPLGSDATNTALTELTLGFRLWLPAARTQLPPMGVTLSPTPLRPPPQGPVRGILLTVKEGVGGTINVTGRFIYGRGKTSEALIAPAPSPDPSPDMTAGSLEVVISGMKVGGGTPPPEFWTDVSLLTLPTASHDWDSFTFDWFFTGDVPAPSDAIKEAALREMIEAQARIIAVSPPIPLEG